MKHRSCGALLVLVSIIACPFELLSKDSVKIPMAQTAPKIDGILDDPAWPQAANFSDFKTMKPDFGRPPSEKTIAYLTYDHESLYVALRCFDREPARIKATMSRRDSVPNDDWVAFCLDASNDQLTSFAFLSNPLGVQMDGMLDSNAEFDPQWDGVWTSAARIVEDGYTVEIAIPFKTPRFPNKREITMGFKVARNTSRKSEEVDFPEFSPARGAALAQFEKIVVTGVKGERGRELLPYFTWGRNSSLDQGVLTSSGSKNDLGLTAKLGITSDLILDATYHPDFSQVEADTGQIDVNLRYSLFYPEKRPFFLEGSENFGFGARTDDSPLGSVAHTRTIVDPRVGFKLNGKIGGGDRLSILFALDDYPGHTPEAESDERLRGQPHALVVAARLGLV